jgi:hypothetical protein
MWLHWRRDRLAILLIMAVLGAFTIPIGYAQTLASYQVGAYGDWTSAGNYGVSVSILTNAYQMDHTDGNDAFFILSHLSSGAFIQFGYSLHVGDTCLQGFYASGVYTCQASEDIQNGDARWFWQYWPNSIGSLGFYSEIGPSMSAGANGTWHRYSIVDYENLSWSFVLDGQQVSSWNVKPTNASEPPYEGAEQVTSDGPVRLGPVEFRNMSYFSSGMWHTVAFLRPIRGCGINSNCKMPAFFDSRLLADNYLLAGSLLPVTTSTTMSANMNGPINAIPMLALVLLLVVFTITAAYCFKKMSTNR